MVLPSGHRDINRCFPLRNYFASTSFTCFKNCSSICRACGPAVRSSRSSASSFGRRPIELVRAANLDLHHFGQRDEAPKVINRIIFIDFRENVVAFLIEMIVVAVQEGGQDDPSRSGGRARDYPATLLGFIEVQPRSKDQPFASALRCYAIKAMSPYFPIDQRSRTPISHSARASPR